MKCPLDFPVRIKTVEGIELRGGDCIEGECAWWDDVSGQCAVYALVRGITTLERAVSDIEAKLPQARQTY